MNLECFFGKVLAEFKLKDSIKKGYSTKTVVKTFLFCQFIKKSFFYNLRLIFLLYLLMFKDVQNYISSHYENVII